MVNILDLDNLPKHYIIFDGKKCLIKQMSIKEDVRSVELLTLIRDAKDEKTMIKFIHDYVKLHIDIPVDILNGIGIEHFDLIVNYMERIPKYNKGWTDEDIDLVERADAIRMAKLIIDTNKS